MPRWTWHNVFSHHDAQRGKGDQGHSAHGNRRDHGEDEGGDDDGDGDGGRAAANLALNLWFVAGGRALEAFNTVQGAAMDRLVHHNDQHLAPDVPAASFLQEDEEGDDAYHGGWDARERRESDSLKEDGEREFDMLGCDTADVDAPCSKRRIRELLGLDDVAERRVDEDEDDERDDDE